MESKSAHSQDQSSILGTQQCDILRKSSLTSISSESVTLSETEQALADFATRFSPQQRLSFIDYSQKSLDTVYGHRKKSAPTLKPSSTPDSTKPQKSSSPLFNGLLNYFNSDSKSTVSNTSNKNSESEGHYTSKRSGVFQKDNSILSQSKALKSDSADERKNLASVTKVPPTENLQRLNTSSLRTTQVSYAFKRRLGLLKIMRSYASNYYSPPYNNQNKDSTGPRKSLEHYWIEALPYCVSHYLDLNSILQLRQACVRLYYRRRYAVSHISFHTWSSFNQEEIISTVLPQLRSFLTAGSFAQLNFSQCCYLADSFPKSLLQYDQQRLIRFVKALIFDYCYALSDKSLEILCSSHLPYLEVLSLRCARSRDLTGAPFSTHLSKAAWPRFHQLSCSCTQIALPNVDAAARFLAERAIEMNVAPKLGISGSLASYSLIYRLNLDKEYNEFLDALLHSKSLEIIEGSVKNFEQQWMLRIDEPEHKTKVLHRLVRNRGVQILMNVPCSVAIVSSDVWDENRKWVTTKDSNPTAILVCKNARKISEPPLVSGTNARECCHCWQHQLPMSTKPKSNLLIEDEVSNNIADTRKAQSESESTKSQNIVTPSPKSKLKSYGSEAENQMIPNAQNITADKNISSITNVMNAKKSNVEPPNSISASSNPVSGTSVFPLQSTNRDPIIFDKKNVQDEKNTRTTDDLTDLPEILSARWMYPLLIAIRIGNLDIVKFLVGKGAYVNVWGYNFATPLYIACSTCRPVCEESANSLPQQMEIHARKRAAFQASMISAATHNTMTQQPEALEVLNGPERIMNAPTSQETKKDSSFPCRLTVRKSSSVANSENYPSPRVSTALQKHTVKIPSPCGKESSQEGADNDNTTQTKNGAECSHTSVSLLATRWEEVFDASSSNQNNFPNDSDRMISPESICLGEICTTSDKIKTNLSNQTEQDSYPFLLTADNLPDVTQSETSTPKMGVAMDLMNADNIRRQFTFGLGCFYEDDDRSLCGASQTDQALLMLDSKMQCDCECHRQDCLLDSLWATSSSVTIVQYLLDSGAPVDAPDLLSTKCPVNAAIKNNNLALLDLLIRKKALINLRNLPLDPVSAAIQQTRRHQKKKQLNRFGYKSSLFIACELEAWRCVEKLLHHGADPHWRDSFSSRSITPALLAYRKNPNTLGLFLHYKTGHTKETRFVLSEILTAAILQEDLHTIEYLVTECPDLLEFRTKCMWSLPLIQAARLGKVDIVKRLISLGANPNAVDSEGLTSLHFAANEGRKEAVECLLQKGAMPNIKGGVHGKTSLHIAVEENFKSIVPLLLQYGADVTIRDNAGHTALMTAVAARNDKVAMLLIDHATSAELDILDGAGRSALLYAIYFGQFKIANGLVDKGVTCKVVDATGVSAESLLRAKIDSFGKTVSSFNKFLRNIVGGASQQISARKDVESNVNQGMMEKGQGTAQSSITVREMNAKRKKIAKALLKKIRVLLTKKPSKTFMDTKSQNTITPLKEPSLKISPELTKKLSADTEATYAIQASVTSEDWPFYPLVEEDDYDVISNISSSSSFDSESQQREFT